MLKRKKPWRLSGSASRQVSDAMRDVGKQSYEVKERVAMAIRKRLSEINKVVREKR